MTEGLLPEGEARTVIEDRLGVRRGDTFGLRCEVRWMEIASPTTGEVLRIEAVTPVALHMSTTHFTADDLFVARNEADLTPREELIVHLDVAHRGLGTASCGPDVLPGYRLAAGTYDFAFRLSLADRASR